MAADTDESSPRNLVISLSNIGDAVMTTPVLEVLHHVQPEARIDLVSDRRSETLFEDCPFLGEVICRDKREGWRGSLRLLSRLRQRRYQVAVDLRTDVFGYLVRAQRRFTKRGQGDSPMHAVEGHLAVIDALVHEEISQPATTLWLSKERLQRQRTELNGLARPCLALGIGAKWNAKCWPVNGYAGLVARLRDRFPSVVLFGGPGEIEMNELLAARFRGDDRVVQLVNLAGKHSLLDTAAAMAACDYFIGGDSGLGHIAAAAGLPTMTLFGPGRPHRYRPWTHRGAWLQAVNNHLPGLSVNRVEGVVREHLQRLGDGLGPE